MPDGLIDIKKNSSESTALCCPDKEEYPYGTTLDFSDEMVDMLGVGALDIGQVVEVRGLAYVKSRHESESENDSNKSVTLQMTSINTSVNDSSRVEKLYGDDND